MRDAWQHGAIHAVPPMEADPSSKAVARNHEDHFICMVAWEVTVVVPIPRKQNQAFESRRKGC